ncbi:helix-turn-helix domain-containing protein [Litchfieldella rifensis]|uniref:Helix-turn-helix domain-containing protein n=1 Tax=Litchfieldella rifensis TaxID=762643 RepID=A0ABV7LT32_9GAMM
MVRSGSLKQVIQEERGTQLTNFYLPGELVGLDGIDDPYYPGSLITLETSTVCEFPFHRLDALAESDPKLRHYLYGCISKELRSDHRLLGLLLGKTSDERLAFFLWNLSERFHRQGYSAYRFRLPMTRTDIAHYLGLAVETISRTVGRFQRKGMISVTGREVHILDMSALIALATGTREMSPAGHRKLASDR